MAGFDAFAALVPRDHGLAVVSTTRADGTVQSSVVNVGVLDHPRTGTPVVGFVVRAASLKLRHLRVRPHATVVLRVGWQWAAVDGPVELIGPHDPVDGVDADGLRLLLREVFTAAGGTHDDWDAYDQAMVAEERTVILVEPVRTSGNA